MLRLQRSAACSVLSHPELHALALACFTSAQRSAMYAAISWPRVACAALQSAYVWSCVPRQKPLMVTPRYTRSFSAIVDSADPSEP